MKMRLILFILLLLILVKDAYSVGISPGKILLDFKPNLEQTVTITVMNTNDYEMGINVGLDGDIAKYVTLNQTQFILEPKGAKQVHMLLKLPASIGEPGDHVIMINANEIITGTNATIGATASINSKIIVNVPYPGKYVFPQIEVNNANKGDTLELRLSLKNYGSESVSFVVGYVDIYDIENKSIKEFSSKPTTLLSKEMKTLIFNLNTDHINLGDYRAQGYAVYENKESIKVSSQFRIGELFINISNHTNRLITNTINRFDIYIENFWNSQIGSIYADVNIFDKTFKTTSSTIDPWEKKVISAFIDAEKIKPGEYSGEIILYYSDKTNKKSITVVVDENKLRIPKFLVGITVIAIIIAIIIIIIITSIDKHKKADKEDGLGNED